jgi:hypothetical protein
VLQAWVSIGDCNGKHNKRGKRGQLMLDGNFLGEALFQNVLEEMDEIEGSSSRQNT